MRKLDHSLPASNEMTIRSSPVTHPLKPLSGEELGALVQAVKSHIKQQYGSNVTAHFKAAFLVEPPKAQLAPYLDELAAGGSPSPLPRCGEALLDIRGRDKAIFAEYYVSLSASAAAVDKVVILDEHSKVGLDAVEMIKAEEMLNASSEYQEVVKKLRLPEKAKVIADCWIYGADTTQFTPRKLPFMMYYTLSDDGDSCHYAYPLPFIPVIDTETYELAEIQWTPVFGGESTKTILDLPEGEMYPWELHQSNEYMPHLLEAEGQKLRSDVKPYRVSQPEGASFQVKDERIINWQKWAFFIGFTPKEGIVVHDIRYDGRLVFHRLSMSEMTVPYGDPRAPFHRKQAFDFGDCGAGITANELSLGCDCLGEIHYLDFDVVRGNGHLHKMKNVVCIHEQDDGIAWKHTNFRTEKAAVARSRVLIVQSIITVANYEYIFMFKFDTAAAVHIEMRATGILSTHAIMPNETSPYGAVVAPGVFAPSHQHLFSARIDPAIDGHCNTVVQEDSVPMPYDVNNPPANNPYGVGYVVEKTPITVSGFADAKPEANRVFKIINPNKLNPISGRPVGYKLVPPPSQLMLAHKDSVAHARAEFADHHIWVTAHRDDELFSGGKYTNQSVGKANGIRSWVARKDNVENTDAVVWCSFGMTHNPRVEDFPVMPCEAHMISLKPVDFFERSPAIDLPPSTQHFNRSTAFVVNSNASSKPSCCKD